MEKSKKKSGILSWLKKYLWSKNFLTQIVLLIVIGILSVFLGLWALKGITHHGETISVPNFEGLSLKEALDIANEKKIELKIIDSVYLAPGERGSVVEQNPSFNFKVKEKRKIFITIKAFSPEKTEMPDLHGISLQQAKAELENYGLKIGKLDYEEGYENVIIEQTYKGAIISTGSKIIKRERINLILGDGPSPYTNLVELNSLTIDETYNKLTSAYLNLGKIHYDNTIRTSVDSANAQVWKQEPNIHYTQKLDFGAIVNVWLTTDKIKVISSKISKLEPIEEQEDSSSTEEIIVPN